MFDFTELPEAFSDLQIHPIEGVILSERIIDPLIIISKKGPKNIARLAGTRMFKGVKFVFVAPSNRHSWVMDGSTIRPLPNDASKMFAESVAGFDPEDLSYSSAVRLIRKTELAIPAEPDDDFFSCGRDCAEKLGTELQVAGLNAKLFPYQVQGVHWMMDTISHKGGVILADEMGLGKTLQIIALLLTDIPHPDAPALIVCPTSLIANWVREISRFSTGLSVLVHRGANRAGIYKELQKTNVVVTTYDTMVNDISIFSSFEWSWVICDEAQAIKNPDSNRRKAIVTIPRRSTVAVTGTPVENTLLDLWSLADFVVPGLLGTSSEFETQYPDSADSAQAVSRLTDPLILRRRVADVAGDLPARIDIDIPLELDDQLAEHYVEVLSETLDRYPVAGALVSTLQLQLVCAHPWLRRNKDADEVADADDTEVERNSTGPLMTPKMERAVELLREAFFNGQKVIVFALFNRVGELLKEACLDLPLAFWGAINGSTPQDERQPVIDAFTAYSGPGCLVLNPKAAGAGLNITAATIVIHYTPVWNPALEAQASARAHRRGQTQPVTVYRLFYKDTVEEVMLERALWKSELANESVPVASRNADDLMRAMNIYPGKT